MHFFFRLSERKRCQKERTPAVLGVATEIQRLTFFFWYLFCLRQGKKKSTQINYQL